MQNKSLVGNSIIHRYQTKLEEIRVLVRSIEAEKHHLEEKKKDVSRDYSQAAQSIKNLYIRCQSSVRTKATTASTSSSAVSHTAGLPHTEECLDHQLDAVSHRLADLIEISSEYRIDEDGVYDDVTVDTKSLQGRSNLSRSHSKKAIRK
jgi:chromosome segregation ATPase